MDSLQFDVAQFEALADTFVCECQRVGYPIPDSLKELMKECLPNFSGKKRVLDAGCGVGLASDVLKEYADTLDGIDLSSRMLEQARAKDHYTNLFQGELTSYLSKTRQSYDLIVALTVLQCLGDLNQFINSALARLNPAGWLFFNVAAGPLLGDGYYLQPEGFYTHSPQYVMQLLGESGVVGGKILRLAWPTPFPYADYSLLFAAQRPNSLD